ncbi:MAG: hypothetical protein ABI629_12020 [bacterium]
MADEICDGRHSHPFQPDAVDSLIDAGQIPVNVPLSAEDREAVLRHGGVVPDCGIIHLTYYQPEPWASANDMQATVDYLVSLMPPFTPPEHRERLPAIRAVIDRERQLVDLARLGAHRPGAVDVDL